MYFSRNKCEDLVLATDLEFLKKCPFVYSEMKNKELLHYCHKLNPKS